MNWWAGHWFATIHDEGYCLVPAAAFYVASLALFLIEELSRCCNLSFLFLLTVGDTHDMVDVMMHQVPLFCSLGSRLV